MRIVGTSRTHTVAAAPKLKVGGSVVVEAGSVEVGPVGERVVVTPVVVGATVPVVVGATVVDVVDVVAPVVVVAGIVVVLVVVVAGGQSGGNVTYAVAVSWPSETIRFTFCVVFG